MERKRPRSRRGRFASPSCLVPLAFPAHIPARTSFRWWAVLLATALLSTGCGDDETALTTTVVIPETAVAPETKAPQLALPPEEPEGRGVQHGVGHRGDRAEARARFSDREDDRQSPTRPDGGEGEVAVPDAGDNNQLTDDQREALQQQDQVRDPQEPLTDDQREALQQQDQVRDPQEPLTDDQRQALQDQRLASRSKNPSPSDELESE